MTCLHTDVSKPRPFESDQQTVPGGRPKQCAELALWLFFLPELAAPWKTSYGSTLCLYVWFLAPAEAHLRLVTMDVLKQSQTHSSSSSNYLLPSYIPAPCRHVVGVALFRTFERCHHLHAAILCGITRFCWCVCHHFHYTWAIGGHHINLKAKKMKW